jgi:hypothetical protein
MKPYLEPTAEFFDRTSTPPEIVELWEEWSELDPATARMIRTAVSSRDPRLMRRAWQMLAARAELAQSVRPNGR